MRLVVRHGTKGEVLGRRAAGALGVPFRCNFTKLPGTSDLVLPSKEVAVFVHGCFWHRHTCRAGLKDALTQQGLLAREVQAQPRVRRQLRGLGLSVVVIWECEARASETVCSP